MTEEIEGKLIGQITHYFGKIGVAVIKLSAKLGLGLAIAKALVLAQGGSIHVESSSEDQGTTFVPAKVPKADDIYNQAGLKRSTNVVP